MREPIARWMHSAVWGFPLPDLLLAAFFCLIAVASVATGNPDEGPLPLTLPVAVVTTAALAWRARSGAIAVALIVVAGVVQTVLSEAPGSLWSLAVYAIVMYSVAANYPEGPAAIIGAVMVAALLVEERIDNGVDYLFILLLFGGLWLLGRASRHWRGRVSTAEQRQRDAARLAVAEERVRIARDLHDVVAHSLSVIAVQSDAAEAALEREPARAAEPVRAIRSTARGALTEIRGLLDVLRADDAPLPGTGSPGISAIDGLVDSARASGVPIEYRAELTNAPLPPAIDLTVYRIVQECLTNVIKHAQGSTATVSVRQSVSGVHVSVVNSVPAGMQAAPSGNGYGLIGVRERARAVGGTMTTGATADGGFRVSIDMPLAPSARGESS